MACERLLGELEDAQNGEAVSGYERSYFEGKGSNYVGGYRDLEVFQESVARTLIHHLRLHPGDTVLDYGCAAGYLVAALRRYNVSAYGMDFSSEILKQAPSSVQGFVGAPWDPALPASYHWILAKDVLEHMTVEMLDDWLRVIYPRVSRGVFVSVPVTQKKGGEYIIPAAERDSTHVIREPGVWWSNQFHSAGFDVRSCSTVPGINDKYARRYPGGQAIFVLTVPAMTPTL